MKIRSSSEVSHVEFRQREKAIKDLFRAADVKKMLLKLNFGIRLVRDWFWELKALLLEVR